MMRIMERIGAYDARLLLDMNDQDAIFDDVEEWLTTAI